MATLVAEKKTKPVELAICLFWPTGLWLAVSVFPHALSPLVISLALILLNRFLKCAGSFPIKHLSKALLVYTLIEIATDFLPSHQLMTAISYSLSSLFRNAYGAGPIVGHERLGGSLILLTLSMLLRFQLRFQRVEWRRWIPFVFQLCLAVLLTPIAWANSRMVFDLVLVFSAAILVQKPYLHLQHVERHAGKEHQPNARFLKCVPIVLTTAFCGLCLANSVFDGNSRSGDKLRILFVDSGTGDGDMTDFEKPLLGSNFNAYIGSDNRPKYGVLCKKLLPALGHRVDVKSIPEIGVNTWKDYDVVTVICAQESIPIAIRDSLLNSVSSGDTSLLVFGDHTDIGGVQQPFDSLLGPVGIQLEYDSVFPLRGDWTANLDFKSHPIHGTLSLFNSHSLGSFGYSVGASLNVSYTCTPILIAREGYSDLGTPDAHQIGGLGDMRYTSNEPVGGQVLAAERVWGKGRVVAFGDTAFIQNSSVSRNFSYINSVFEYMGKRKGRVGVSRILIGVVAIALALSLLINFSFVCAIAAVTLFTGTVAMFSPFVSPEKLISKFDKPVILVESGLSSANNKESGSPNTFQLISLLNASSDNFVAEMIYLGNGNSDLSKFSSVVLLAPKSPISALQSKQLTDFVKNGNSVLVSMGYYESRANHLLLEQLGCRVLPVTLGSSQELEMTENQTKSLLPNLSECWKLDLLSSDWDVITTSFGEPVIATRQLQLGHVGIISDGSALLDDVIQHEASRKIDRRSYDFLKLLLGRVYPENQSFSSE